MTSNKSRLLMIILFGIFQYSCNTDDDGINPGDERPNSYLTMTIDGESYSPEEMEVSFNDEDPSYGYVLTMSDNDKNLSVKIMLLEEGQSRYGLEITMTQNSKLYSVVANENLKLEVTTDDRTEKKMIGTFQADLNTSADNSTVEIRNGIFNAYYD